MGYRDPVVATKLALKSLARRVLDLNDDIAELDRFIVALVEELAPKLLELEGVGTDNAGAMMVAAGENPNRLRSEASFAMMCGVCPIPASSGKIQRHRLNRGGNRQANSALHMIVVCRMRTDQRTRAYGQGMDKCAALAHPLPTLGALAPTSPSLLQQRFMEQATAPAPAGSRITPSSQEIRLRNTPTNSCGDPTRECEKQQR